MRADCAFKQCGRYALKSRKLCGIHATELDDASVTVWSGGELLLPREQLAGDQFHGFARPDFEHASIAKRAKKAR